MALQTENAPRSIPIRESKTDATGEGAAVYLSC
jgi:hypothetical protein